MFGKARKKVDTHEKDKVSPLLNPNCILWIAPHTGYGKVIDVLDLTGQVKASYGSEDFEQEVKRIAKDTAPEAWLTFTPTSRWYIKGFVVSKPGSDGEIAKWKAGLFSTASNSLSFPEDSPHSSHPITVKTDSAWKLREKFIKDSVTYYWKPDSITFARHFNLTKVIGNETQEIGKYREGKQQKYGGILVLDTNEIDAVVAAWSMVSILRKKRQRAVEAGGGGAGGVG